MGIAIGRKGRADLQGGKPPSRPVSGRKVTITANGHATNGKPKKPRGGAGIPVVDGDEPEIIAPPLSPDVADARGEMGPAIKAEASEQPESETKVIPIGRIDASPTNPRKFFDEAKLAELAESIRTVGLLQPILVRPKLHRYEIVAGERRFRAAQLAQLDQVECKVRWLTDWEALKVQWTENAERDDINEIEEAQHFQRMLDAREGLTQQQLAEELGTSQGQIANRLRLLDLPEAWQKKVISQEITATHGRELVPFVRHADALKELAEDIKRDGTPGSIKQFREALEELVSDHGIELSGQEWDSVASDRVSWKVPLTAEEREEWGVVEVDTYRGKVLVAIPCDAAQAAADKARQFRIDEARKKAEKRNKKAAAARPGESAAAAAERKDEQFARRLAAWKTDWLRVLCAERLEEEGNTRIAEIFFLAMVQDPLVWEKCDDFEQICERIPTAPKVQWGSGSLYEQVRACATAVELEEMRITMARSLLVDEENDPVQLVEHDDVDDLANELELPADLEAIWRKDQAGELSEAYWSLHTIDQLETLGEELGIEWRTTGKKNMVVQLLETKNLALPAELGGKKRAAKKPAKKKGAR